MNFQFSLPFFCILTLSSCVTGKYPVDIKPKVEQVTLDLADKIQIGSTKAELIEGRGHRSCLDLKRFDDLEGAK